MSTRTRVMTLAGALTTAALLLSAAGPSVAGTISTGHAPKSLMVQLSTWNSAAQLRTDITEICAHHHDPSADGYISDLVLQNVATLDPSGAPVLKTALLDILLPHFPGGSDSCRFERVFVGTIDLTGSYTGGNAYNAGIRDAAFRERMRTTSASVARAFTGYVAASATPAVSWDWYITFESMLNYLGGTDASGTTTAGAQVAEGYRLYLTEHMADLDAIHRTASYLWSPGVDDFPDNYATGSAKRTELAKNLGALTAQIAASMRSIPGRTDGADGPLIVDLQDHVGSTDCSFGMSPQMAVSWARMLKSMMTVDAFRVNVEQFRHVNPAACSQGIVSDFGAALNAREDYYVSQGLTLGAAWELRFWAGVNKTSATAGLTTLVGDGRSEFHQPGETMTVTGTLLGERSQPLAGKTVQLVSCDITWGKCALVTGAGSSARTDATGAVRITTPALSRTGYLRLYFPGDATDLASFGQQNFAFVVSTTGQAVTWSGASASGTAVGGTSAVTGKLTVVSNGWSMTGANVVLVRCASALDCADGSPVLAGVVGSGGVATLTTPALGALPAYFLIRFIGNGTYAAKDSPIVSVAATSGRSVAWSEVAASPAAVGGTSAVSGTLTTATDGRPMTGSEVVLVRCGSAVDCAAGSAVAAGTVGPAGAASLTTPTLGTLPAFFRIRFLGDETHAAEDSPIVSVAKTSGQAVVWSGMAASGAVVGGTSVVTGKLAVVSNGWSMTGANVVLMRCGSATDCSSGTAVVAAVVGSGGMASVTTPVVEALPAFFQLRFLGNGTYAAKNSPIVTVAAR